MSFFGLFGGSDGEEIINEYLAMDAIVVDVRTPMEYDENHAPGSILIPMDKLKSSVEMLKEMNRPVILVCLTGARASSAKRFYKKKGIDAINGGFWKSVLQEQD